ncbi:BCL-2-associated athanogene 3 [Perilla frutescens var. hirtella]|nr:BCL-2-associated athanogene 3 [Perilla frutescens var. hirtella]
MMRMRTTNEWLPPQSNGGGGGGEKVWELRPGGMLVQKRTDVDQNRVAPPTIRVRVKYGSIYHEINISSQATFGELKKMLTEATGLHHQDQKLLYKEKERDSNAFLDRVGVKDKSKMVLQEDPISQEKRYLEMRKNAKMEKAAKTISQISFEVDRLGGQVSALQSVVSRGGKLGEKDLVNLIELLMNQLLKLDAITADGDVKLQRKMQVRRVQKYVETLDMLKIKNASSKSDGVVSGPVRHQQGQGQGQCRHSFGDSLVDSPNLRQQPASASASASVVITTQWETFDSIPTSSIHGASTQPSFTWDLL